MWIMYIHAKFDLQNSNLHHLIYIMKCCLAIIVVDCYITLTFAFPSLNKDYISHPLLCAWQCLLQKWCAARPPVNVRFSCVSHFNPTNVSGGDTHHVQDALRTITCLHSIFPSVSVINTGCLNPGMRQNVKHSHSR